MGSLLRTLQTWFHAPAEELEAPATPRRTSLALQQFVPLVTEAVHPAVLDLGCVWQSTVNFFTGAGCKLYAEDVFAALHQALRHTPPLTGDFLRDALQYREATFRGILVWDFFDYLPEELVEPLAARLYRLLEPGGALLAFFHNRQEARPFARFRVVDQGRVELPAGSLPLEIRRTFSNRALLDVFAAFSSSRTFVGRDNFREFFLIK